MYRNILENIRTVSVWSMRYCHLLSLSVTPRSHTELQPSEAALFSRASGHLRWPVPFSGSNNQGFMTYRSSIYKHPLTVTFPRAY